MNYDREGSEKYLSIIPILVAHRFFHDGGNNTLRLGIVFDAESNPVVAAVCSIISANAGNLAMTKYMAAVCNNRIELMVFHEAIKSPLVNRTVAQWMIHEEADTGLLLLFAVSGKTPVPVVRLLVQNTDVNRENNEGMTIWNRCILYEGAQVDLLRIVLHEGKADLTRRDQSGLTALHGAVLQGNFEICALLVEKKFRMDLDATAKNGWTALHFASYSGSSNIVKLLLREQARLNAETSDGLTAVYLASSKGHTEALRCLIESGYADVNRQDEEGMTALHLASLQGYTETLRYLVESGYADVNRQDEEGMTALHLASLQGYTETLRYLVESGYADVNRQDEHGMTALHLAASVGLTETVSCLVLYQKVDANLKNANGDTPLLSACRNGHREIAAILLKLAHVKVNVKTPGGLSALQVACTHGHAEIVKLLLEEGAELNMRGTYEILSYAASQGHTEVLHVLCKHLCLTCFKASSLVCVVYCTLSALMVAFDVTISYGRPFTLIVSLFLVRSTAALFRVSRNGSMTS